MGLRFRKSIRIAPCVKFNLNKKSVGLTVGTKGAHYTINSKGKRTASVGIPGTGLSYSTSSVGGSKKKRSTSTKSAYRSSSAASPSSNDNNKKWYQKPGWIILLLILFFPIGIYLMFKYTNWSGKTKGIICAVIAALGLIGMISGDPEQSDSDNTVAAIESQMENETPSESQLETEMPSESQPETETPSESQLETETPSESQLETETASEAESYSAAESEMATESTEAESVKESIAPSPEEEIDVPEQNDKSPETAIDNNLTESPMTTSQAPAEIAPSEAAPSEPDSAVPETANNGTPAAVVVPVAPVIDSSADNSSAVSDPVQQPVGEMVWLSATGQKYHRINNCGKMNPDKARQVTLEEAIAQGMEKCEKCY